MYVLSKAASITQRPLLKMQCCLCSEYHTEKAPICHACEQLLLPLGPACIQCATPLPDDPLSLCGHCIKKTPAIDKVFTIYRFEEPLRTLLHDFKYREKLHLSQFWVQKMLLNPPKISPNTCLIPVPIHKKRLYLRGFNQAAVLAYRLGKTMNIECSTQHIQKIKNTAPQAELEAKARQKNLRGSFKLAPIHYQHVILVDDLITTGSTANELADQLKKQGVQQVDLWCIAKTCLE